MQKIKDYLIHNKFFFLFVVLITYFVFSAFFEARMTQYIFGLVFSALMLISLLLVSDVKKPLLISAGLLAVSSFIVMSSGLATTSELVYIAHMFVVLIFLIIITSVSLYTTYKYESVTFQTLYGAICTYLLMGLTWSELYCIIFHLDHHAFSLTSAYLIDPKLQQTFYYYSFVTLSTLGYGDILPISMPARTFSWLEAIMGQGYLTILIAQIVGQYIVQKREAS